jgi:hypothetical protein
VANRLLSLKKYGGETPPMNGLQGCWRPWTSWSGPTHRGCGTVDVSAWNWENRVVVLDMLGMVPFHRTPDQGFSPHIHMVLNGMGCVDPYAQGQIVSCKNGRDGLKANGRDPDILLRSHLWPLAVYQGRTGMLRASRNTNLRALPTYNSNIVKVCPITTRVNAIMEVNVGGDHWFVTDTGGWGFAGKWAPIA